MKKYIVKIELTEDEVNLLNKCKKQEYLEYRDSQTKSFDEYREDNLNENSYNLRNENGTLKIAEKLSEMNMLDLDYDAWHLTFILTDFGKQVLRELKNETTD